LCRRVGSDEPREKARKRQQHYPKMTDQHVAVSVASPCRATLQGRPVTPTPSAPTISAAL
jgi:hypothetical protein